jgi:hypothetical protein
VTTGPAVTALERDERRAPVAAVVALAASLTLFVLVVVLPNLWYGLHDITDIPVYLDYARQIARGLRPYYEVRIEYPPLAVPFFRLPGHLADDLAYARWFSISMGAVTLLAAAVTGAVAARLWPVGDRAYWAAALFAAGVAFTGAIIVNRYDAVVALLVACFLLCLVRRWYVAAAVVLGLGFALKITPAAMLPLVLLLAGPPRRWLWPLAAFGAAALAPFIPYLGAPGGLWHVFQYHLERPLQIESVLGTPMLLGQLLGAGWAEHGWSHGSHSLLAPGVGVAADLSGGLTFLALAAVYWFAYRRRARLRAAPVDVPLAVLALILALMTFGKVLSPQYVIWTLPAVALVAARDRLLGSLALLVLVLTQAEFPSLYWRLLQMEPDALAVVVTRNLLLVAAFGVALWRLWTLPEE